MCSNPSFDAQAKLAEFVFQVEDELGVHFRPELRRSPSMEKLFAPQVDFLVTSKEVGTISLAELKKFSGTIEQNILNEKMVDHFIKINSLSEKYTNKTAMEVLETYNVLIAQAHALNKDSYVTLAEGVFTVAKDIVEIAVLDPPIKEIENYFVKTVTNPKDYIVKTVEGYKCVASIILQACKHSLSGVAATPEQRLELAETSNKFIHNFFEGWQKLETSQKKEFLAEVIVDTVLNKVVFSLPKLLLKMGGSSAIGDIVQKGESFFSRIDPGSSGGTIAMPIAAAEHVVEAVEFAAGVAGSTAIAITSAGAQNVVALSEMMDGGGGNNFLPSTKKSIDISIEIPEKILNFQPGDAIKEFSQKIIKRYNEHIFSDDHITKGIMNIGRTRSEILGKFVDLILEADKVGLLKKGGDNTMHTIINGYNTMIKVRLDELGKVMSINGYLKTSENAVSLGNIFTFILEKYQ